MRNESLQAYLGKRIRGVGPTRAKQMVDLFGADVLQVLGAVPAAAATRLRELPGVGPQTAAKMKQSWDAGAQKCAPPAHTPCADPGTVVLTKSESRPCRRHPLWTLR